jgi:hypothetical protein
MMRNVGPMAGDGNLKRKLGRGLRNFLTEATKKKRRNQPKSGTCGFGTTEWISCNLWTGLVSYKQSSEEL